MNKLVSSKDLRGIGDVSLTAPTRSATFAPDADSCFPNAQKEPSSALALREGAMAKRISSKHLEGISDLTLKAPIKQGFIDAFEAVTYETRLKLLLEGLFKVRSTAREYAEIKPFVDTAERIQSLLDFRLAILDIEPRTLLLSATFDRPFEPYMRLIWNPLGALLDVIFCNCEGYVPATENSFEDYVAWIRRSQIDSDFFYGASGHSVNDVQYLAQIERLQREGKANDCDGAAAAATIADLEEKAARVRADPASAFESNEMAVEALVALYRLADFYPVDRLEGDGKYLLRAAQDLLIGWNSKELPPAARMRFAEQLRWFETPLPPPARQRREAPEFDAEQERQIQPGILGSYGRRGSTITHGCLLLMRVMKPRCPVEMDPERAFIGWVADRVWEPTAIHYNVAFTEKGLTHLGVPETELNKLPQEFREGMEERAGLLGDVRGSHPRRWKLPKRWRRSAIPAAAAPVEMSEVDIVIQLRTHSDYPGHELAGDPRHPLYAEVEAVAAAAERAGIELLAVEPMRRAAPDPFSRKDHFGFADGFSQPALAGSHPESPRDEVAPGELFWGYANNRDDGPPEPSAYFNNGSFLVIRKLRQDVAGLNAFLDEQAARIPDLPREDLLAKMMGRSRSGAPLLPGTTIKSNDFDYENDREGLRCPFQAHVRRANPRAIAHGRPTPRILRRGLSYGPPYRDNPSAERGVFFMAYNASIAEQFEVIQRWINGGNSSGVASCQSDPLMGVAQSGDPRTFRFHHDGKLFRVDVPKPFVRLEWGLYLFTPSRAGLETIANGPAALPAAPEQGRDEAERGEATIRALQALAEQPGGRTAAAAAWKAHLEDFGSKDPAERNEAAGIWAAIRDYHQGALRVPYTDSGPNGPAVADAVLVASKALVEEVFSDPNEYYSMKGQKERMDQSFGSIFLGMDRSNPEYLKQSKAINEKILSITEQEAFKIAYQAADAQLERVLMGFLAVYKERAGKVDLRREFLTPVLAGVCRAWFGIPDEPPRPPGAPPADPATYHVAEGGWSWQPHPRKPRCPGDYMAPSRYCFYPDPVAAVRAYGEAQGQGLHQAVLDYVRRVRAGAYPPAGALGPTMFDAIGGDDSLLASTIIGVMTGFLPPADGSLRWTLYEWFKEKTLWRLQSALLADPRSAPEQRYERAAAALRPALVRAMQKRPSPDLLWRTVVQDHDLGPVAVAAGEKVVIGIVSATAEQMAAGDDKEACLVFGGDRERDPPDAPTHACPGYKAAMGTMLGMLSALLEKGRIEALPAPLIVRLSDPRPLPGA